MDYFVMGPCFIVIKQHVVDWGGWLIEHCLHCRSRLCPLFNGKSLEECSFAIIWKSSTSFYRYIVECQYLVAFRRNEIVVSEVFTSELLCCCLWCRHVFIFFSHITCGLTLSYKPPSCHSHELGLDKISLNLNSEPYLDGLYISQFTTPRLWIDSFRLYFI